MSLISIIIPVYNVERFLCRCVDSVLAQTFGAFEVILVDDGSSDRSGEICDAYAQRDGRVRVIHKQNGGVSSARNRGLDEVSGQYICFIDSDDWIDPTFLADFRLSDYSADIYISGALYDIDNKVYSYKKYEPSFIEDRRAIGEEFTRQNIWQNGYPWGKLYSTEIIRSHNLRFDEVLSIHEDHVFVFEYYTHIESIYVTDSAGYHYLVIDGTSRKLSSKVNSYSDLITASERFATVLNKLLMQFEFCCELQTSLYNSSVIGCRLCALSSIFLDKSSKGRSRYNSFKIETAYWREQHIANRSIPLNRLNRVILSILTDLKPVLLSYIIVASIYTLKSLVPKNWMKLILQDLQSRSVVVN